MAEQQAASDAMFFGARRRIVVAAMSPQLPADPMTAVIRAARHNTLPHIVGPRTVETSCQAVLRKPGLGRLRIDS